MRKQITIPDNLDEVVKKFAEASDVSESAVISYGINLLCIRFNCAEAINEEIALFNKIREFYQSFYIQHLPRGKKANEVRRICKKTENNFR